MILLFIKKNTLVLILFLFASIPGYSQVRQITGVVVGSDDKQPIIGASVKIQGTSVGTVTKTDGTFSIQARSGNILIISYVGYTTKEISVGSQTSYTISITPTANSLNEIVVTGYAAQRKKDLVGAVSVVDVSTLNKQPVGQVTSQLQGQASGVTVVGSGQPGEEPQVKIRGVNTFGNNQPLYVVDGIPTTTINDINPNDISSLQVLKDAGSASIYGARAANGVIIITTKRGTGKPSVSYDAYYGEQVPPGGNVYHLLNPQELANLNNLVISNTATLNGTTPNYNNVLYGPTGNVLPDYINPPNAKAGDASVNPALYNVNPFYPIGTDVSQFYRITMANKSGTDWFHEIFKTKPIQSHNVALSGGSDLATYFFSLNYYNQQGTLIDTYNKRYTIRANTTYNISKRIRAGENLSYSVTENPQISENNEGSGIGMAFREQPIIPVYDIMGNYAGSYSTGGAQLGNAKNPVAIQNRTANNYGLTNRLFGNVFAEADILKNLSIRTTFGGEYFSRNYHTFTYPEYENLENTVLNSYTESPYTGFNYTWTNTLSYHFNRDKHDLKVLVGTEAYNNFYKIITETRTGYFSFDPNYTSLATGTGTVVVDPYNTYTQRDALFSYLGRLDYNYDGKYLLGATLRRDGSSRFLNNQYGWFPAVSLGWRISQESFLKNAKWITDLKIRGGYGVMGNQVNVTPSNAFTTYGSNPTTSYYNLNGTSGSTVAGFYQNYRGNPDAKWEKDANSNIGFDGTFFDGKLDITLDYYKKTISDLLYNPTAPGTAGVATAPYINIGKMTNHGFDGAISSHINITTDFKLDATATLTTYSNKILKISDTQTYFDLDQGRFNGSYIVRNQVGGPVGGFFGYKVVGFWNSQAEIDAANAQAQKATGNASAVYQTDAGVGRFRYADTNGSGQVTAADRTLLGNPNPKFTGGLNLAFTYKQFDFSMFIYGSYGNKIWNDVKWWTDFYSSFYGAKSYTALYDSWTPTHMNATAPIQETTGSFSTNSVPNSYFIENGSYLRARNTQLGYTFNPDLLKRVGVSHLRVYLSAANLFTITNYSGIDPQITGSSVDFGVDRGQYPISKTYLLGVQLKF